MKFTLTKTCWGKLASGFDLENTIRAWIDILVSNSNDPAKIGTYQAYIDNTTGLDLAQAINKTLLGAVVFSQGVNVYLADIESRENNVLEEGKNYTDREHRFDEAFGYFGAARNYFGFTDNDLASNDGGTPYKDNFIDDGEIDFRSEYNFGFSANAGKRDRGSTTGTDYTKEIMDAFLAGRHAIVQKDDIALLAAKETIIRTWEKIIAATVIHYINDVTSDLNDMKNDPATAPKNYFKHWAEMYFFTQAFRYNEATILDFATVLDKLNVNGGQEPKYLVDNPAEIDTYLMELAAARSIIQDTYGFDISDVENW